MSLINDALKRAQQTQNQQAQNPLPGAPLHIAPSAPGSNLWPIAIVCLLLAVIISVAGIWYLHKTQPNLFQAAQQAIQSKLAAAPAAAPKSGIIIIQPAKKIAAAPPAQNPTPAPATPATPAPAPAPKPVVAEMPAPTLAPPPVVVEKPAPAPPPAVAQKTFTVTTVAPPNVRLQGILYRPEKPAAIINGRTVFIGDHVGDSVVHSITSDTVTLLQGSQLAELHL